MMKLGLKPRSRRVVQDSSMAVEKSKTQTRSNNNCVLDENRVENYDSSWSWLPLELVREILAKLEESESKWPERKHVVACAGVCKSWREIMKELVRNPEVSGRITFPISVKQPGPRESILHCYIKRDRSAQTYYLYMNLGQALAEDGKFLLCARKCRRPTCTDYMIYLNRDDMSKGRDTCIGKLRSNFLGTKFVVIDALPTYSGSRMARTGSTHMVGSTQVSHRAWSGYYPVANISYELNVLGARGPRRMHCLMGVIPSSAIKPGGSTPTQTHFPLKTTESSPTIPFFRSKSIFSDKFFSNGETGNSLVLRNKSPRWHEQLQCWCLNFNGRVSVASVKNFQLVASPENGVQEPQNDKVILQFGKVGKDEFTMDYRYPISAFQAFAICLSSFDTKIACE